MSNKVKSTDIIEQNIFENSESSAKSFLIQVELLEKSVKQLSVELAKLHAMQGKSYDDIVKLQQGALELIAKNDLLIAAKKEAIKIQKQLTDDEIRQREIEKKASADRVKTIKEEIALEKTATDSLVRKRIEYARLAKEYDNGSAAIRDKLLPQMKALDSEIKKLEEDTGRHQRSVGNYKKAYDGLGMAFMQLTREAPAFVNSMQTGFMAISNNIPMFTDQISLLIAKNKELKASGEPTVSVFKQLASAIISPQTALSVGIVLLTLYGKELVTWTKNLFTANKELERQKQIQKEINDTRTEGIKNFGEESAMLSILFKAWGDSNRSLDERKKALLALQDIFPEHFKNLKLEESASLAAAKAYDLQAKAIYNVALNEAYVNKIKKNVSRLVEIQEIRNKIDAEYELMKTHAGRVKLEKDGVNVTDKWIENAETKIKLTKEENDITKQNAYYYKNIRIDTLKQVTDAETKLNKEREKEDKKEAERLKKERSKLKVINDFRNDIQKGLSRGINIFEGGFSTQKQREDYLKSVDELDKLRKSQAIKDAETEVEIAQKAYEKRKGLGLKEYADLVNAQRKLSDLRAAAIEEERRAKAEGIAPGGIVRADDPEYATKMNNILAINEKAAADEIELKRKTNDEIKKLDDEMLANMKGKALDAVEGMAQMYGSYLSARAKYNEKVLEKQYDANQLTQQRLINATAQGSAQAAETLAYEQKRSAEIQAAQKKNQEAQAKQELFLALLSSVAGEMRGGASLPVAITKSIASASVLRGIAAAYPLSFFDGTDDTGKVGAGEDLDGRGGRLMMIHENEMIFSAAQRVRLGGSREEVINKVEQFDKLSNNNDVLVAEMREVKQAIIEKPSYMGMDIDILGGVVDYKLQQGNTLRIIKKNLKNI